MIHVAFRAIIFRDDNRYILLYPPLRSIQLRIVHSISKICALFFLGCGGLFSLCTKRSMQIWTHLQIRSPNENFEL